MIPRTNGSRESTIRHRWRLADKIKLYCKSPLAPEHHRRSMGLALGRFAEEVLGGRVRAGKPFF
jgi:hypothetical protein